MAWFPFDKHYWHYYLLKKVNYTIRDRNMALLVQRGYSLELGSILINFQICTTIWNLTERVRKTSWPGPIQQQTLSETKMCLNYLVLLSSFWGGKELKSERPCKISNIKKFLSSLIENICLLPHKTTRKLRGSSSCLDFLSLVVLTVVHHCLVDVTCLFSILNRCYINLVLPKSQSWYIVFLFN